MFDRIRRFDERVRAHMGQEAERHLGVREEAVLKEFENRMKSNPVSAQAWMNSYRADLGMDEGSKVGPQQMQDAAVRRAFAARAARDNPGFQMRESLAGTGIGNRAQQVAAYGGMIGGGLAALTASGQGLMHLMEYIEEGKRTQQAREQEMLG